MKYSISDNVLHWLESIISERFGYKWTLLRVSNGLSLQIVGSQGEILFDTPFEGFTQASSDQPFTRWDAEREGWSLVLAKPLPSPGATNFPSPLIELKGGVYVIHYDIIGLIFWMLARVEEVGRTDLDNHQRFPASSSHAFKHGYLDRPIVDEWLNILGQVIQRVWPGIELKQHLFTMNVSHDVDMPARYAFQNFKGLVRTMGGDLLNRKEVAAAIKAPWIWLNSKQAIHPKDPANTFDWLMKQSEENGLMSAFYFICGRTDASKDAKYDPEMPQIRKLMRDIHQRGHEIGLHPSYNTYNRPEEIAKELNRLRKVCGEEGISQSQWGGRMHFLRWNQGITLEAWADAGMSYDSTLSYADRPGFRCGTCFEYPAFDAVRDKHLPLRIRPLVAMDCTVIAERYLGLGSTEMAYEKFNELKNHCRKVGGNFTLLWHNSFFNSPKDFDIYHRLVSER